MSLAALLRGFLGGGVAGGALSAFVTGIILEDVPLILTGVGLPVAYGVLLFVAGVPRRAREAAVVPRVALAKIESRRAGGTETGDVPVTLVLTVAPDGQPSFRVEIVHHVNLADLPDVRAGDVLVVQYPPDRPWLAKVVPVPGAQWRRRAADAVVESAPESAVVAPPPEGCAVTVAALLGLLLGAAIVVGPHRVELFSSHEEEPGSSSTTVVTSSSSSVSMTIVVDSPDGLRGALESSGLPAELIPDLERQAAKALDAGGQRRWQFTVGDVTVQVILPR
ncbi:hypothetical protein MUY14_10345 [Amycolatopsis sp. FBCC-B4732]|uniref:hypothetical protein n=1 Tax=Amycolatopsis sp. FBCC-B4732 TaxID=3079339 RepID=UPI001FF1D064|nr:hypothetical protein [Amycolatopsis sp. FBCC-B4732]UOX90994.1 hypothetical protein MUY14_10345 [Amycolatopsis sp. FBCC-B4732]